MTPRRFSRMTISLLMIALLLAFALPLVAQINDFFPPPFAEGGLRFDGAGDPSTKDLTWRFSWATAPNESSVEAQIKATMWGQTMWVTPSKQVRRSGDRTKLTISAWGGAHLTIRVRVANAAGQISPWRELTASR
ncbi:MAG: hypothetical protein OXE95_04475 [Chloroflexi bacterium]|nr:hypothetical protein [Chloroflexota bacterium]MCY4246819.1 hypothetical protein [Chloroflexota bacterium]